MSGILIALLLILIAAIFLSLPFIVVRTLPKET